MHAMHARLPKHFVLEERLERYADAIEVQPQSYRGNWAEACWPLASGANRPGDGAPPDCAAPVGAFREVRVDLGCGKGAFLVESAQHAPEVLFVGIDAEPLCMAYAAQHVMEAGLRNAVLVPAMGDALPRVFAPAEVSAIYMNFPTPYPRKRDAARRLVALERLLDYRQVLSAGGTVRLRTDSQPLRDFFLTQLELAGYEVTYRSDDDRAEHPDEPQSEYEQRLCAQGAKVLSVWATPGPEPEHIEQTASLSLVDYLPDDLFAGGYVPHGMGQTIHNLRNRRH